MENLNENLIFLICMFIFTYGVAIFTCVHLDKIIVYYDEGEHQNSILTSVVIGITYLLIDNLSPFNSYVVNTLYDWTVIPIMVIFTSILVLENFISAIRHNNIILGLFIGIFKLFFGALSILMAITLLGVLVGGTQNNSDRGTNGSSNHAVFEFISLLLVVFIWIEILVSMTRLLINGPRVYLKRGQVLFKTI